jgi:hypothetical protein
VSNPVLQLCLTFYAPLIHGLSVHPTPPTTGNCEAPLFKPSVEPMHIILSPDNEDSGMYGVIGYSKKRDKTVKYDVLFDDCEDPVTVNAK